MKTKITLYVRPDGIIVGIKGEAQFIEPITNPLGKGWRQPKREDVLIFPDRAEMTQDSFDLLYNYSNSTPSGVYEGKMYRKDNYLHWWSTSNELDKCSGNVRKIQIVIQSGHPFEDQEWAFKKLAPFIKHGTFLPPIELDVKVVCQWSEKGKWHDVADYLRYPRDSDFRTVLRIAKEEVKPTEEATETQDRADKILKVDFSFPERFKLFLDGITASDQMGHEEIEYFKRYADQFNNQSKPK